MNIRVSPCKSIVESNTSYVYLADFCTKHVRNILATKFFVQQKNPKKKVSINNYIFYILGMISFSNIIKV